MGALKANLTKPQDLMRYSMKLTVSTVFRKVDSVFPKSTFDNAIHHSTSFASICKGTTCEHSRLVHIVGPTTICYNSIRHNMETYRYICTNLLSIAVRIDVPISISYIRIHYSK